jgi:hypothetical protein
MACIINDAHLTGMRKVLVQAAKTMVCYFTSTHLHCDPLHAVWDGHHQLLCRTEAVELPPAHAACDSAALLPAKAIKDNRVVPGPGVCCCLCSQLCL